MIYACARHSAYSLHVHYLYSLDFVGNIMD